MMKNLRFPVRNTILATMLLPVAAYAQFDGKTCVDIPTATTNVPAPGTGTITVEGLTKFGIPAKTCVTSGFTGSAISYDYTATLATRYNSATFPSSCAGITYGLNGGPVYTAVTGQGNFAFNIAAPTAPITGTLTATSFTQTENLTLTAGGASYVINTGLLSLKTTATINADQSIDMKICTPKGGIPATVNGSNFTIPTNVWKCLATPATTQANVRVTYEEGC